MRGMLATALALALVLLLPCAAFADAVSNGVLASYENPSIGDGVIERRWTIDAEGRLVPGALLNARSSAELIPARGSQDFVLTLLDAAGTERVLSSGELRIAAVRSEDGGRALRFDFEPFYWEEELPEDAAVEEGAEEAATPEEGEEDQAPEGPSLSISYVVAFGDVPGTLKTRLELASDDPSAFGLAFADMERLVFQPWERGQFSVNVQEESLGAPEGIALGQPAYAGSFFFGSEFPAAQTCIEGQALRIRYWSGRSLEQMEADGLARDGRWTSWSTVVGTADSALFEDERAAFFSYIEDCVASPAHQRLSYDPWYDRMQLESSDSLVESVAGMDDGLRSLGLSLPERVMVDDGWNNYNLPNAVEYMGSTENSSGFWEFNSKFPDALHPVGDLARRLGSAPGLWLSPRGGDDFSASFAQLVYASGTGELRTSAFGYDSLCVAAPVYLDNLERLMVGFEDGYGVCAWDLPDLMDAVCGDASHGHMTGGPADMYYVSDLWEKWCAFMEAAGERETAPELILSGETLYSPWLLRWVDAIAVPGARESSSAGPAGAERHQRKTFQSDQAFFELLVDAGLQVSARYLVGGDPVYGIADESQASPEVWREYLAASMMRGSDLWNLRISSALMDAEHWLILRDALMLRSEHAEALSRSIPFRIGDAGAYGWSAWTEGEGLVSLTNPTSSPQRLELVLGAALGVDRDLSGYTARQIQPLAAETLGEGLGFGDSLSIELEPYATKLLLFSDSPEETNTQLVAYPEEDGTLVLSFSERMGESCEVLIDGQPVQARRREDLRSYRVDPAGADLGDGTWHVLEAGGLALADGTELAPETLPIRSAEPIGNVITGDWPRSEEQGQAVIVADEGQGMTGAAPFSVSLLLATTSKDCRLAAQEGEWSLGIDDEGFLRFEVAGTSLSGSCTRTSVVSAHQGIFGSPSWTDEVSEEERTGRVDDGKAHLVVATREADGSLRLYLDGELIARTEAPERSAVLEGSAVSWGSEDFEGRIADASLRLGTPGIAQIRSEANAEAASTDAIGSPQPGGVLAASIALAIGAALGALVVRMSRRQAI